MGSQDSVTLFMPTILEILGQGGKKGVVQDSVRGRHGDANGKGVKMDEVDVKETQRVEATEKKEATQMEWWMLKVGDCW